MLSRSGHQKRAQKHKRNNCERCGSEDRTRIKKYGDPLVGQVWDSRQAAFIRLVERALT